MTPYSKMVGFDRFWTRPKWSQSAWSCLFLERQWLDRCQKMSVNFNQSIGWPSLFFFKKKVSKDRFNGRPLSDRPVNEKDLWKWSRSFQPDNVTFLNCLLICVLSLLCLYRIRKWLKIIREKNQPRKKGSLTHRAYQSRSPTEPNNATFWSQKISQ